MHACLYMFDTLCSQKFCSQSSSNKHVKYIQSTFVLVPLIQGIQIGFYVWTLDMVYLSNNQFPVLDTTPQTTTTQQQQHSSGNRIFRSRACGSYYDFLDGELLLTRKLLDQGFLMVRLISLLQTFYGRHHDLVSSYGLYVSQMRGKYSKPSIQKAYRYTTWSNEQYVLLPC